MSSRKDILDKALHCVNGDRDQQYGSPERSFETIADLWTAYLRCEVTPKDAAAMLALLKIARIKTGAPKEDNWIDLAGYAACGGELDALPVPVYSNNSSEMDVIMRERLSDRITLND